MNEARATQSLNSSSGNGPVLDCAGIHLDLRRPRVMGILNVTPDSFSDGGRWAGAQEAIDRAHAMCEEGAELIDIGGESTRPGAKPVGAQQEMDRVLPVIEALGGKLAVPLSIDTSKPEVMSAAVKAGAGMINDVYGLRQEGALEAAAAAAVPVCIMHMQGEPRTMQQAPQYSEVVADVQAFLEQRDQAARAAGIEADRILLDPGFGFGKTLEQNLALLAGLDRLLQLGRPILAGLSRKSMLGQLGAGAVEQRLPASLAAAVLAAMKGARIIRVHDVAETAQALSLCRALLDLEEGDGKQTHGA